MYLLSCLPPEAWAVPSSASKTGGGWKEHDTRDSVTYVLAQVLLKVKCLSFLSSSFLIQKVGITPASLVGLL